MDVFNLYAKLSLNTDDYEKGVEKAKGGASSLMDVFSGTLLGNVVSDGLRSVANGITEIGKTAANMAVSIGKASLDSYADYEQLVGGVETLYKDSAGIIENYAKDAYKNVGLSANDYMETSTSFAAALVSSLGGDTEKAAEMANTAISDMSDNANKMGTNMQSIQDAYNGFAKQNYTMLDNLKIGYGGTQAEMKRLIKEAAAMTDTQKELGVTVDSNSMSYANIVQAIHVVQANMGIMGTTSKEAATTIQGSTASMKSAWENLLTGIADPEQDFQTLVDNLVDSVITAGNNIIPRIKEIVPTLIDGLSELVTQLAPYVSSVIMELEPTIEEGLQALFGGLSSVASELQPIVADVFSFFGDAIISGLTSAIENSDFSFLLFIFDNVKTAAGDVLAVVGQTGNAAGTWTHCHFEVRATATSKGLDPTAYAGIPNKAGTYGGQPVQTSGEEVLIDVSHHQGTIDWAKVPYRALVRMRRLCWQDLNCMICRLQTMSGAVIFGDVVGNATRCQTAARIVTQWRSLQKTTRTARIFWQWLRMLCACRMGIGWIHGTAEMKCRCTTGRKDD